MNDILFNSDITESAGATVVSKPPITGRESRPSRLEFIDALRGFACIWVLLCHVQGYWLDNRLDSATGALRVAHLVVSGFCRVGVAGVDLFIVLSGFCLYWPVVRGWRTGRQFKSRTFFQRRARRIVPAYYVAVLLCSAIALFPPLQRHYVPRPPRALDIVSYLGFVMTFVPYHLTTVNGTYWSIALEAQLYLCFPAAVWLTRRRGILPLIQLAIAVAAIWQILQLSGIGHRLGISPVAYIYHLPARFFEFVAGMFAAQCVATPRPKQGWWGLLSMMLALPVALLCAKYAITTLSEIEYAAWGVVFAGLILYLANLPGTWFVDPFRAGLITRVGIVSYSLYLIHAPVMLLSTDGVLAMQRRLNCGPLTVIAAFLMIGVPLLTTAAYGFYLLFEKPFMNPARTAGPLLSSNPDHPADIMRQ